jgi:hypothetical protein
MYLFLGTSGFTMDPYIEYLGIGATVYMNFYLYIKQEQ